MSLREPFIEVACGAKGVGKTFTTLQFMNLYLKQQKRKILVYDVNYPLETSYDTLKKVSLSNLHKLQKIEARRIVGVDTKGKALNIQSLKDRFFSILQRYTKGLLVLEDINRYITTFNSIDVVGALTTNRHKNLDILIHLQSLRAMDTRLWQNTNVIRFHKQQEPISKCKDRIPNFELMQLAENIVEKQYKQGNKRFFVWVNLDYQKIYNANMEMFRDACEEYLVLNPPVLKQCYLRYSISKSSKNHFDQVLNKFVKAKAGYLPA